MVISGVQRLVGGGCYERAGMMVATTHAQHSPGPPCLTLEPKPVAVALCWLYVPLHVAPGR